MVVRIEELIAEHHPGIILFGDEAQSAMLHKAVLMVLSKTSPWKSSLNHSQPIELENVCKQSICLMLFCDKYRKTFGQRQRPAMTMLRLCSRKTGSCGNAQARNLHSLLLSTHIHAAVYRECHTRNKLCERRQEVNCCSCNVIWKPDTPKNKIFGDVLSPHCVE